MKRIVDLVVEALGTNLVEEIEMGERVQHVRSTATICIACGVVFSAFNLSSAVTQLLGFAELFSLLLFFFPAALLINRPRHIFAAETLLLLGALWISSALIILGGIEGTGLFWVYSVPFLCFFIKGQRRGWYYSLAFFSAHTVCLLWLAPRLEVSYPYTPVVRTHFLLSMGFYVLIAAAFNHARSRFETALQMRRSEAEAASLAKSRFLAAASHDLRQPAHALGLFVARLGQMPNAPEVRELLVGVDASVQALQDMLDAFFDYSRLDSQLTHAHLRSFALQSVFDKLHTSFAEMAQHKGLRLCIRPTAAWVVSDPVLLHRVLLNLLSNAVQHTPSGSVLLCCRPAGLPGRLRIQVRDSGIGIACEHQQKVFEEFYQVENPERDRNKGLGLGLSIVERSCKLLDHRIALRSALGCGSTFSVELPAGPPEPPPAPCEPLPAGSMQDVQGMHVLLIEDDELGRAALQGLLRSWGCQVQEAPSAEAALLLGEAGQPMDFILSDYRLLGPQSGVEAVHRLRQQAGRDIPACIVSGDTDTSVKQHIALAGLPRLQKPVKPAKLRSLLRNARVGAQAMPAPD